MIKATHKGATLWVPMLIEDDMTIRDTVFDRCDLRGPAVVVMDNCRFRGKSAMPTDPDSFFVEIKPTASGVPPAGMILIMGCEFRSCEFYGISIAGTADEMASYREHLF